MEASAQNGTGLQVNAKKLRSETQREGTISTSAVLSPRKVLHFSANTGSTVTIPSHLQRIQIA